MQRQSKSCGIRRDGRRLRHAEDIRRGQRRAAGQRDRQVGRAVAKHNRGGVHYRETQLYLESIETIPTFAAVR